MDFYIFLVAYILPMELVILPFKKYKSDESFKLGKSTFSPDYQLDNNYLIDLLEIFRPALLSLLGLNYHAYRYLDWIKVYTSYKFWGKLYIQIKLIVLSLIFALISSYLQIIMYNSFLLVWLIFLTLVFLLSIGILIVNKK